jgi:hypothetical protein
MHIDLMPFVIVGGVLILSVVAMIVWRKTIAAREDDTIHVLEDAALVPQQVSVAHRLEIIDKWGKLLTAVTIAYVLAIGALFLYQQWLKGNAAGM